MASRVDSLPDRSSGSTVWLVAFFVVVYVASAVAWVPILRSGRSLLALTGPLSLLGLVITIMPSLVAILLSGLRDGWPGVRALLGQAGRWRFALSWYVVALALTVVLDVVALGFSSLFGSPSGSLGPIQLQLLLPFAPLGEEFGWRGYALPRLQKRMAALPASLVLGVIWACWHLPYFTYPSIHPLAFGIGFPLFLIIITCESVLATWIYNSTGGSLLATILYHEGIRSPGIRSRWAPPSPPHSSRRQFLSWRLWSSLREPAQGDWLAGHLFPFPNRATDDQRSNNGDVCRLSTQPSLCRRLQPPRHRPLRPSRPSRDCAL